MVVFGQSGCNRSKLVLLGLQWLYSGKAIVFLQSGCIRAKVFVFGQSGCIPAKYCVILAKWLKSVKSGCNRAKVVEFEQSCLYLGESVCSWRRCLCLVKVVVFGQK